MPTLEVVKELVPLPLVRLVATAHSLSRVHTEWSIAPMRYDCIWQSEGGGQQTNRSEARRYEVVYLRHSLSSATVNILGRDFPCHAKMPKERFFFFFYRPTETVKQAWGSKKTTRKFARMDCNGKWWQSWAIDALGLTLARETNRCRCNRSISEKWSW